LDEGLAVGESVVVFDEGWLGGTSGRIYKYGMLESQRSVAMEW
jgi:hypothetical protein